MRSEKFVTWLLAPLGFLLIAGGLAFQQFEAWAVTQPAAAAPLNKSLAYPDSTSQLKMVSSENRPTEAKQEVQPAAKSVEKELVVTASLQAPQSIPVKTEAVKSPVQKQPEIKQVTQVETAPSNDLQVADQVFNLQPVLSENLDHLLLDFDARIVSEQNLKRAIVRVLLSPDPYAELNLISRDPFNYKTRPAYYRQVINHRNQPIRYPREAMEYAEFLVKPYLPQVRQKQAITLKIPLRESNLTYPARRYESWVMQFARDFRVSPALVLAIMETESNFDPKAVSRSKAKGLMQIKPNSAGRDVYKYIDFKFGAPSDAELFDEASNIRMGTAYLSLLKYEYFAEIRNPEIKEMIAISSYNGGLSTVWRLFGATPEEAVAKINRLRPQQVYRTLRYEHASDETRRYLDKVLQAKNRYQALLGEDARILAARAL